MKKLIAFILVITLMVSVNVIVNANDDVDPYGTTSITVTQQK